MLFVRVMNIYKVQNKGKKMKGIGPKKEFELVLQMVLPLCPISMSSPSCAFIPLDIVDAVVA